MTLPASITERIAELPESLQSIVKRWCESIAADDLPGGPGTDTLCKVVACSEFAANVLQRDWRNYGGQLDSLGVPHDAAGLAAIADSIAATTDLSTAASSLRTTRNDQLLRILWREIAGTASVAETLVALSDVADQLLRAATACSSREMVARHGQVRDSNAQAVQLVIIAMGKLGGRELNFSSDIDIIFAYAADGESDGPKPLPAQTYFDRLSRKIVRLMDEVTEDGFVFRTDTRLRPFGDSGPPVISFAALESYLLRHGRDWERYAYVKARLVGASPEPAVARELCDTLITPFVYRGYLDYGVLESLREMHGLIAAEGRRRESMHNVKLGPGGIREVEFIVQSLQLVRGGDRPELQTPSLLEALPLLVDERGISDGTAKELRDCYLFLRRIENFIQALHDKQTHSLPTSAVDQQRLCLAMGFADWHSLHAELERVRAIVARHFAAIAFRAHEKAERDPLTDRLVELWASKADVDRWRAEFAAAGFADASELAAEISRFQSTPATNALSKRAGERLQSFMPKLLSLLQEREQPVVALQRSLAIVSQVLRRSSYLALLNENPVATERLVEFCAQSAYISTQLARFPVLLDELLDARVESGVRAKAELQRDLDERLRQRGDADSEEKMESLAQFQRATMFRIAVSDFAGQLPIMQVSDSLTFLAEVILAKALEIAWQEMVQKYGYPCFESDGRKQEAGFAVIAYGKLGGLELSYGSDLDVVFLHDSRGEQQETNGDKPLDNAMFFSRLVRRLVHFLTTRTSTGAMYEIDTRLRPSGRKGLLVTSAESFRRYQQDNAWTWEHQALLRARAVAGSEVLAATFDEIRTHTLCKLVRREELAEDVQQMRQRMRKELDDSNREQWNLKHGAGGIGDIEFLVQYLVLQSADDFPAVIEFTDNIRQLNALAECGALSLRDAAKLQSIYRAYRRRQHHLALDGVPAQVAVDEFRSEREDVQRIWHQVFES